MISLLAKNRIIDAAAMLDYAAGYGTLSNILHRYFNIELPVYDPYVYLRPPVHTAFHTNKSMEILMQQWGYKSSAYSLPAKSWILFRDPIDSIRPKIEAINKEIQSNWFYCKEGFVDYWKGF